MTSMQSTSRVVITSAYRWSYFEWFLLGLYQLADAGEIELEFALKGLPWSSLLQKVNGDFMSRAAGHMMRTREADSYNMDGYVVAPDGSRHDFTVDSADAPFLFDEAKLAQAMTYFKMQCPIDLEVDGFELAPGVVIPWCDHMHADPAVTGLTTRASRKEIADLGKYLPQIHPLMIGPRRLARGISKKALEGGVPTTSRTGASSKKAQPCATLATPRGRSQSTTLT